MNAHGEGYVKGFLDAGSIPAGSTKKYGVPFGTPYFFFWVETVPTLNPSRIRTLFVVSKGFSPCSHRIKSAMRGHIPHSGILRNAEQCTSPRTEAEQNMQNEFRVANSRHFSFFCLISLYLSSFFIFQKLSVVEQSPSPQRKAVLMGIRELKVPQSSRIVVHCRALSGIKPFAHSLLC